MTLFGCAQQNYRNHRVPAFASPSAHGSVDSEPVRLLEADTTLLRGGLRIIRPDVARPTRPFTLTDERGIVHTPESLRGRVVWLDLWAVWCGTCRAEFPFVQEMHERFEGNGFTVLAVCRNSTREGFQAASSKDWIDFPLVDANDDEDFPFPYHAFPTSVLLDREGRIRAYWQGHRSPPAVEDAVRHLLGEAWDETRPAPVPTPTGADVARIAVPAEVLSERTSQSVLRATLVLPREPVPAGGYFQGMITLDVDPGWHLSADPGEGFVPLELRFDSEDGFQALGHQLPHALPVDTALGPQDGHAGVLQLPVWGMLDSHLTEGESVPLTIVATVQACDRTKCLPPAEVVMASRVWVGAPNEAVPVPPGRTGAQGAPQ
ncbi:MAG: hypothetical protein DHS20C21_04260 [Gemmatimonadota bacterium]|nr:MAG: hypothetical protein DHS20C21_04260 [Gemmatimonadota bacterium]